MLQMRNRNFNFFTALKQFEKLFEMIFESIVTLNKLASETAIL